MQIYNVHMLSEWHLRASEHEMLQKASQTIFFVNHVYYRLCVPQERSPALLL